MDVPPFPQLRAFGGYHAYAERCKSCRKHYREVCRRLVEMAALLANRAPLGEGSEFRRALRRAFAGSGYYRESFRRIAIPRPARPVAKSIRDDGSGVSESPTSTGKIVPSEPVAVSPRTGKPVEGSVIRMSVRSGSEKSAAQPVLVFVSTRSPLPPQIPRTKVSCTSASETEACAYEVFPCPHRFWYTAVYR